MFNFLVNTKSTMGLHFKVYLISLWKCQSGYGILLLYLSWMSVLIDSHPCHHLVLSVFSSQPSTRWFGTFFISLISNSIMTFHMLVCCPYVSLGQLSARVFCPVLMRLFCLVIADSQVFFIHFRHQPLLVSDLKVFSFSLWIVFPF